MSHGQDTNGQNARYGRASAKWGADPDVLKALAIGKDDPGGVVGRYQLAAEKFGTLSIKSVHRVEHYFDWQDPSILWTRENQAEIRALVDEADIIHLNNSYMAVMRFHVRKPMLLHHHGSLFRNNPQHMLDTAKHHRMLQAVSTIDLTRPAPKLLHWLPTAYDIDALAAFARKREVLKHRIRPDGRIRIVSAPTNRELKSTEQLIVAVKHLQAEGLPIDLELIEGRTNLEVLTAKATADIVFDQTMFGYGCNAVEAWGMGVPVIAGADPWTLDAMRKEWGRGGLPFYSATDATIIDAIRDLATSKDLRDEFGARGLAHVRKYHDEKPALERLAELYGMAIKHYSEARNAKVEAVTFRNPKGRPIYADDKRLEWQDGTLTTDDPYIISRLRKYAQTRPNFGIEEVA
jgi:hypothetical protein